MIGGTTLRRFKNSRFHAAMVLVVLLHLAGSCANSGNSQLQRSKDESEYQVLSKTQAHELFGKIRSQNADIEIEQQFFLKKSFHLGKVEALTQESLVACIAFYRADGDDEHLGILAVRLQGNVVVETTSGILWLTTVRDDVIASGLEEGPKLESTSTTSLIGWWNCIFPCGRRAYRGNTDIVPRIIESSRSPLVECWFRERCY